MHPWMTQPLMVLPPCRFAEIQNTPPLYERWIKAGCEVSQGNAPASRCPHPWPCCGLHMWHNVDCMLTLSNLTQPCSPPCCLPAVLP
jgi:hypothetical protein